MLRAAGHRGTRPRTASPLARRRRSAASRPRATAAPPRRWSTSARPSRRSRRTPASRAEARPRRARLSEEPRPARAGRPRRRPAARRRCAGGRGCGAGRPRARLDVDRLPLRRPHVVGVRAELDGEVERDALHDDREREDRERLPELWSGEAVDACAARLDGVRELREAGGARPAAVEADECVSSVECEPRAVKELLELRAPRRTRARIRAP